MWQLRLGLLDLVFTLYIEKQSSLSFHTGSLFLSKKSMYILAAEKSLICFLPSPNTSLFL